MPCCDMPTDTAVGASVIENLWLYEYLLPV